MSTWICIHCSFWSIASLCAQKADCTERWLRFTSREVAHYYFAPNKIDRGGWIAAFGRLLPMPALVLRAHGRAETCRRKTTGTCVDDSRQMCPTGIEEGASRRVRVDKHYQSTDSTATRQPLLRRSLVDRLRHRFRIGRSLPSHCGVWSDEGWHAPASLRSASLCPVRPEGFRMQYLEGHRALPGQP
ncbi:hypothetical protein A8F26_26560 [Burkholderia cenocepacia]|nr:hypothetical protein A8F17_23165 [Burkholderia cenocepacia]ONX64486.1 hypothetical protein A8F14_25460 [Burkholderia cenocepacia]ONX66785.1 hypothetical protein A8F16_13530 [Burkholderia cenocepacia]ONX84417.1 hypothetical protein A8F19_23635 [Burkholderia cenocepacia]ONX93605.1 hypothetical protein A8F26_26560 [Burkholderia cenocepacia]